MTMLIASPVDEESEKSEWSVLNGAESTVRFRPASSRPEQAQEAVREAEQLIAAFRRLLEPDSETAEPIDIYLGEAAQDVDPKSCIVRSASSGVPFAIELCAFVIQRWFGPNAADSTLIVDGIAGIAAGQSGIAPSVEDCEQWVGRRVRSGEVIRVVTRNGHRPEPSEGFGGFDPIPTAFLSFLVATYGRGALRKYLKAYDPRRRDQAAIEAYRQPLAVLEDEWHSRLRRRHHDQNVLKSFLSHVLPLLRPYRWKQVEILVYLILAAGYNVVQPYAVKTVIDRLTHLVKSGSGGA